MKDYIKEGLQQRIGPPLIYDRICKALEEEIAILYVQEKGLIYNEYLGKYVTKQVESSSCL